MIRRETEPDTLRYHRTLRWLWLAAVTVTLLAPILRAQSAPPSRLDPTFGAGGTTSVDFGGSSFERAHAMAVQPDGKIVVAGTSVGEFALTRFNIDGTVDGSFGNGGTIKTRFTEGDANLSSLFLEADGRILAGGHVFVPQPESGRQVHLGLARFTSDGLLDPTFGVDGRMTALLGTEVEDFPSRVVRFRIVKVLRDEQQRFVAVATEETISNGISSGSVVLVRYVPSGDAGIALDQAFADGGVATLGLNEPPSGATALMLPDGAMIAIGSAGTARTLTLARFDGQGTLDETFGSIGITTTPLPAAPVASAAVLQPDGAIVISGAIGSDLALLRYRANGTLDPTFGANGVVSTPITGGARAHAVVLTPDLDIVVAGMSNAQVNAQFVVARYRPNGSPDTSFSDDGVAVTDVDGRGDAAFAVALQADGKIVAAGSTFDPSLGMDFAVARYRARFEADLAIAKIASASTVDVGRDVTFTLTVTNHGPDAAKSVLVRDIMPVDVTLVSCTTSADGTCDPHGSGDGTLVIRFPELAAGETGTATIVATLNVNVPNGTVIANTAVVVTNITDPVSANNVAVARFIARAIPHTLRFFLHGNDTPGTAGGFTMDFVPSTSQTLTVNLSQSPRWFSNPTLTGTVLAGGTFKVVRPCSLGVSLAATYRLAKTNPDGSAEQVLGQVHRPIGLCLGSEVIAIPVSTPAAFANQRLKLTISSAVSVNLDLRLGPGAFAEVTNFVGIP